MDEHDVHRFVQISDVHLGAPFAWLHAEARADRRREQQRSLETAVQLAIERRAEALLIPGDLFDAEAVDVETLAFAVHAFDRPGCPPVFIAPGNHDPSTKTSPTWNPRLLGARGWAWAPHVHVFREPAWSAVALMGSAVTVWGRSFVSDTPNLERPLSPRTLPAPAAFDRDRLHIAVFHGSREDACPPGQAVTAPFSAAEALETPFAYLAAGHYHRASRIDAADGSGVRLAYAGSPVALNAAELGAHGALVVTILGTPAAGARAARIEAIELDSRRMHAIELDVTGAASADEIDRRLLAAFDDAGVSPRDLVRARLTGRIVRGVRYDAPGGEVVARVFALRLGLAGVRPDYDLATLREREPSTTEDRFAHALLAELDAETDPERRARVLSALYYGLDAFRLRQVTPGYESLAAGAGDAAVAVTEATP